MIEPTDEMVELFKLNHDPANELEQPDIRAGLAAVLAIVTRDRCMEAAGHVYHPLATPERCGDRGFAGGGRCLLDARHDGIHLYSEAGKS